MKAVNELINQATHAIFVASYRYLRHQFITSPVHSPYSIDDAESLQTILIVPLLFCFISESWVELNAQSCVTSERTTPLPFASSEEYLRLLKEAQRESGHSSAQISKASSRIDTPRDR
jgi:BNIP3.